MKEDFKEWLIREVRAMRPYLFHSKEGDIVKDKETEEAFLVVMKKPSFTSLMRISDGKTLDSLNTEEISDKYCVFNEKTSIIELLYWLKTLKKPYEFSITTFFNNKTYLRAIGNNEIINFGELNDEEPFMENQKDNLYYNLRKFYYE